MVTPAARIKTVSSCQMTFPKAKGGACHKKKSDPTEKEGKTTEMQKKRVDASASGVCPDARLRQYLAE